MGKIIQTAGKNTLGEFAPEFAHFNDDVLFGENWNNHVLETGWHCEPITAIQPERIIRGPAAGTWADTKAFTPYHLQTKTSLKELGVLIHLEYIEKYKRILIS